MRRQKNKFIIAFISAVIILSLLIPIKSAFASYRFNSWHTTIFVQRDGTLNVTEDLEMYFGSHDGGQPYHWFKRWIDLNKIQGVSDVKVYEVKNGERVPYTLGDNGPGTYIVTREGDSVYIKLNYVAKNTVKHFVITYKVLGAATAGAISFYQKDIKFEYYGIPPKNQVEIGKAMVEVHLPEGASKDQIKAWGWGLPVGTGKVQIVSGNLVEFSGQNLSPGQFIGFSIVMPKGLIIQPAGVTVHPGSAIDELKKKAEEEARKAKIAGLKTLIGFLFFIFIVVYMFLEWYRKGREYPVPDYAEYVSSPPSDLPPAVVGALLKQGATIKEVLATIIDLANRGYLKMEEIKGGLFKSRDYVYTLNRDKSTEDLKYFEKLIIDEMFSGLDMVKLSDLKYNFAQSLPKIYKAINQELVERGFFEGGSPAKVKGKYFGIGIAMIFVGFFLLFFGGPFLGFGFLIWPLILGGIVVLAFANAMPRKSRKGVEEYAKWLAFKRYLEGLLKYKKAQEAKDKFAAYLPFAIVFGIDKSFIREFSRVNAPAPVWYIPYGYYNTGYGYNGAGTNNAFLQGSRNSMGSSGIGGSNFAGGMQGFSLDSISDGLNSLLNSSASVFTSTKSSSSGGGGGFSGGGGFGGGGGGGSAAG